MKQTALAIPAAYRGKKISAKQFKEELAQFNHFSAEYNTDDSAAGIRCKFTKAAVSVSRCPYMVLTAGKLLTVFLRDLEVTRYNDGHYLIGCQGSGSSSRRYVDLYCNKS